MKPAFHKNVTINGSSIQTLIAVIRVTMEDYFGDNFVDFHMLRKEEDCWKIVAKIFTGF